MMKTDRIIHLIGFRVALTIALMSIALGSPAQQSINTAEPPAITKITDITYGVTDERELKLDIYLPTGKVNPPLIIWVHGGAWRAGSKDSSPARPPVQSPTTPFVMSGFAMASLDFRLSTEAKFPAQAHDIKAAIRFLRGNAAKYGYNGKRIGIVGFSSGAHLAALVGVTNDHKELEGTVGDYLEQSSDIDAIVSYAGASNLTTILQQSTPRGLKMRGPALKLLLGGLPDKEVELGQLASPVFHVDTNDPPLLLLHGDQDPQMPINQSHELHGAYKAHNREVHFEVVSGAAHVGMLNPAVQRVELVKAFFDQHLR